MRAFDSIHAHAYPIHMNSAACPCASECIRVFRFFVYLGILPSVIFLANTLCRVPYVPCIRSILYPFDGFRSKRPGTTTLVRFYIRWCTALLMSRFKSIRPMRRSVLKFIVNILTTATVLLAGEWRTPISHGGQLCGKNLVLNWTWFIV